MMTGWRRDHPADWQAYKLADWQRGQNILWSLYLEEWELQLEDPDERETGAWHNLEGWKVLGFFFLNERECRWKAWECSQSRDKKRQEKWGGSETGSDRDRKRCLIKKGSFSCHHQERLWQPAASVSEKKRQETSSPDSHTSRSIGTGDFRSKDRKGR